jgi:hypothetical protein
MDWTVKDLREKREHLLTFPSLSLSLAMPFQEISKKNKKPKKA